jgi:hypothetical protein
VSDWSAGDQHESAQNIDTQHSPGEILLHQDLGELAFAFDPTDAETITCMVVYDDRLFMGACTEPGRTDTGEVIVYDYATARTEKVFTVDEQGLIRMHVFNGKLYIPGFDAHGSHDYGNLYVYDGNEWIKKRTIPEAWHVYDLAYYQGQLYASIGVGHAEIDGRILVSSDEGDTWQTAYGYPVPGQRVNFMTVFGDSLYANVDGDLVKHDGASWEKLNLTPIPVFAYCFMEMQEVLFVGSYPYSFIFDGTEILQAGVEDRQVRDIVPFGDEYALCMISSTFGIHGQDGTFYPKIPVEISSYLFVTDKSRGPNTHTPPLLAYLPVDTLGVSLAAYHGRIYMGTHNYGEVYVTAAKSRGSLTSSSKEIAALDHATLHWNAIATPETQVRFQVKTAPTEVGLRRRTFRGPDGSSSSFYEITGQPLNPIHSVDSWIQYRVFLSTDNPSKTPYLLDVSIIALQEVASH